MRRRGDVARSSRCAGKVDTVETMPSRCVRRWSEIGTALNQPNKSCRIVMMSVGWVGGIGDIAERRLGGLYCGCLIASSAKVEYANCGVSCLPKLCLGPELASYPPLWRCKLAAADYRINVVAVESSIRDRPILRHVSEEKTTGVVGGCRDWSAGSLIRQLHNSLTAFLPPLIWILM